MSFKSQYGGPTVHIELHKKNVLHLKLLVPSTGSHQTVLKRVHAITYCVLEQL